MPILKQEKSEITLPVSLAKVMILDKISYGTALQIREKDLKQDESMLELAASCILEWDLTNEAGEKLPITAETIKQLNHTDGDFLMSHVAKSFAQKKT
jgi:hypothetical protein